jgi:replication factor C subunit 3/5
MYECIINKLHKCIKHINHPNIILYGHADIDKTNIFIKTIKNVYNITSDNIINENNINYIKNNLYYKFNADNIKYKNKIFWIDILKNITKSDNYFINNKKYIIIENFHSLHISIQNILKVFIEKNYHIKFILISDNYTDIINPIKSRCICIRLPLLDYYDKWKIIKKENNININDYLLYKDNTVDFIQNLINIKDDSKNPSILNKLLHYIISIIENYKKTNTMEKIKEIIYIYTTVNIPYDLFMKTFLNILLNDHKIIYKKKFKIIKLFSDVDIMYSKSYYKMIHLEYLILNLINIIKIN